MDLKKELNVLHVFAIATGAMISSGLFILPGLAHAQAGPAVIFSYFLAGLLAATGMLSEAELVSAMPKAGGTYFFVTRSMGPAAGTVNGITNWFALTLKSAFALVGMAAFTEMVLPWDIRIIAALLCVAFVLLNLVGAKEAGRLQVVLVAGLLGILAWYIVRGFPAIDVDNFKPFAPHGAYGVLATTGFVFVSYGGLLKVTSVAEEVRDPARTIPRGLIISLITAMVFYTGTVLVTSGVLDDARLDASLTPITDGARAIMGTNGAIAVSIAAILAFVSTANAGIMAASRYPFALARDKLLPPVFMATSARFHTPHTAIIITGAFMFGSLFMRLTVLVKAASTVLILSYMFSCLSVIILRESGVQNYRPKFLTPLYPWLQIAGIAGFTLLIWEMGAPALATSGMLIAGGLFVYWFYGRVRTTSESALVHLAQRVLAREFTSNILEEELKEIIRERDDITSDRFDGIIQNAHVLDIDEPLDADEFFARAATAFCGKLGVSCDDLHRAFLDRENESSTVIAPGLAIPHIIIEGEHVFDILLVRARPGIAFPGEDEPVTAVFVLAGTRDERNFHLKALAAIAQIVRDPQFFKRWAAAPSTERLRDVVLLGKRAPRHRNDTSR